MTPQERDALCARLFPHYAEAKMHVDYDSDERPWPDDLVDDIGAFVERMEPLMIAIRNSDEIGDMTKPFSLTLEMEYVVARAARALLSGVEGKP